MGTKFKITTDRIIGLSAMVISVLTLIIFIYQTTLMREQSRLSVLPRLVIQTDETPVDTFFQWSFFINNKGIGPAIIEELSIEKGGKIYPLRFVDFFEKLYPDYEEYGEFIQSFNLFVGSTISQQESVKLCTFQVAINKLDDFLAYISYNPEQDDVLPFNLEIVYSSIYQERWKIETNINGHPEPL